jgi:predicted DNA-binding transcriptional regulator AlpA
MERVESGLPGHASPSVRRSARRMPTRAVADRYGVSTRSVERWTADPKLNFPQPLRINKRRYWSEAELDEFDRSRSGA